jgi:hypothetical protein
MDTKKYFLVFLNKSFKYYFVSGFGNNLNKFQTQSKNFILNFLRDKNFLKYKNDYVETFNFEVNLKKVILEKNNLVYEQNILEENFAFYIMTNEQLLLLEQDFCKLDEPYIFTNLFFVEDKKIAKHVVSKSQTDFDVQTIIPIRNYTNISHKFLRN